MKMFTKVLLGITLSTATLGAAVGGAVLSSNHESELTSVSAATTNKTFFLDCTSVGGWDSESICLGTWNGKVNTYTEATRVEDNYWTVNIDISGLVGIEFYRCSPGNTGTRWNKSSWNTDCSLNHCKITNWDESSTWSTVNGADESYEIASTTPSTTTKRIWVDPKEHFYDSNARAALRTYSSSGDYHKTFILGGSSQYLVVGSETLFYVDIPVADDCQLVRLHNALNFIWTYGGDFSDISGYNTAKVVYSWAANAGYSAGNEETATIDYSKRVLDGYSTCLSSSVNGYGNYANTKTQVLDKLSSSDLSTFRSATFTAPTYGTRTYGEKMDLMASQSGSSSSNVLVVASFKNNDMSIVLIAISVISGIALTGFGLYFFKKRKSVSK